MFNEKHVKHTHIFNIHTFIILFKSHSKRLINDKRLLLLLKKTRETLIIVKFFRKKGASIWYALNFQFKVKRIFNIDPNSFEGIL